MGLLQQHQCPREKDQDARTEGPAWELAGGHPADRQAERLQTKPAGLALDLGLEPQNGEEAVLRSLSSPHAPSHVWCVVRRPEQTNTTMGAPSWSFSREGRPPR